MVLYVSAPIAGLTCHGVDTIIWAVGQASHAVNPYLDAAERRTTQLRSSASPLRSRKMLNRLVLVGLVAELAVGAVLLLLKPAEAVPGDTEADLVFGQPNFISSTCGSGVTRLCDPQGVAANETCDLAVGDAGNNRVLIYFDPCITDTLPDLVLGQPDFNANTCGAGPNSLCNPQGVAIGAGCDLYVSDTDNNRVLYYQDPCTTDTLPDQVFGQPDFNANACNTGGVGPNSLCNPGGVAVGPGCDLYVSDTSNNRVLYYQDPCTTDTVADQVFGQPDLITSACNTGGVSASSLCSPTGVAVEPGG